MKLLGIDIGGTNTKVVLREGDRLRRAEVLTQASDGPEALARRLVIAVADWPEPDACGLSVAGLLNRDRILVQAPNLGPFVGADLAAAFAEFGVAVIENDVNCAVYGEWKAGAAQGLHHVAMFSLGTGVGGGLVLGGALYRGAGGLAAELGHICLDPDGPRCPCGGQGHVESWLGRHGFARVARMRAAASPQSALAAAIGRGEEPDAELLAGLAAQGCTVAQDSLAECGRWLGLACANVVSMLQPECILVAGGSARCGELLLGPALAEYDRRCMEAARHSVPVRLAALGVDSAAIGAALLAGASLDADRAPGR